MNDEKPSHELAGPSAVPPTSWSYWVIENRFLAGAYPGSPNGAEHRNRIQVLLNAGVRTFVNLMEEDETDRQGWPFAPHDQLTRELCPAAVCVRSAIEDASVPSNTPRKANAQMLPSTTAKRTGYWAVCPNPHTLTNLLE
jgi:hypothetical protein